MEKKLYMGDKILEVARRATVDKKLEWGRIPAIIIDKLQNQIPGRFEDGFIATFHNYEEKSNIILVRTSSDIPNKRYIIAFYELEANRVTIFPPSEFSDPVYVSGVVALYQLVEGVVFTDTNENLEKQVSLLIALLDKNNQYYKK